MEMTINQGNLTKEERNLYYSLGQIKRLGWSVKLVNELLGKPDIILDSGSDKRSNHLYHIEKIIELGLANNLQTPVMYNTVNSSSIFGSKKFYSFRRRINKISTVDRYKIYTYAYMLNDLSDLTMKSLIENSIMFFNKMRPTYITSKTKHIPEITLTSNEINSMVKQYIAVNNCYVYDSDEKRLEYIDKMYEIQYHDLTKFMTDIIMFYLCNKYQSTCIDRYCISINVSKKKLHGKDIDILYNEIVCMVYYTLITVAPVFDNKQNISRILHDNCV